MGDRPVPLARVGLADPQRGHRPAAEHGGRVHRLARGHAGEPPAGAGAQVAGALHDHGHLGAEHVPGGQQPAVQRDGFQVAAERLPDGHRAGQPARLAQAGDGAGEPGRQRAAVQHHVGGRADRAAPGVVAGQYRGQRGVQVGHHHRHAVQVVGVAQQVVLGGVLLVHAQHAGLERGVPGLDQVPGPGRVIWQPAGHRDDQRVAAGAQAELERASVQQHPVAGLRAAGQRGVGQRPHRRARDVHVQLYRAIPGPPEGRNLATTPPDHSGRVASVPGGAKGGRECPGGRLSGC